MKWILVAALLLAASTTPARADISRYACELYFADTEVAPPEAREILKPDSRTALKMCSAWSDEGSRTFARVFAPLRHPFDVCQIVERQLFKDKGTWTYTPLAGEPYSGDPRVSMMISEGNCPRQDDPRYIITSDITAGIFVTAVQFWRKLSSRDGHDALFADVYPVVRSSSMFQIFESEIRSGAELKPVRVALSTSTQAPTHYSLELEGSLTNWALLFDVTGDGLVIVGIGTIEY
ncbi:MAG TPA: hypothetical protein VIR45_04090 [Kiloniellaceae bacterium]